MLSATNLSDCLSDPVYKDSYSIEHTPFVKALGTNVFKYYSSVRD